MSSRQRGRPPKAAPPAAEQLAPAERPAPASAQAAGPTRYRVLSGGISRPGADPVFQGDIVDGPTLGDAARIQKLLDLGRIEPA